VIWNAAVADAAAFSASENASYLRVVKRQMINLVAGQDDIHSGTLQKL